MKESNHSMLLPGEYLVSADRPDNHILSGSQIRFSSSYSTACCYRNVWSCSTEVKTRNANVFGINWSVQEEFQAESCPRPVDVNILWRGKYEGLSDGHTMTCVYLRIVKGFGCDSWLMHTLFCPNSCTQNPPSAYLPSLFHLSHGEVRKCLVACDEHFLFFRRAAARWFCRWHRCFWQWNPCSTKLLVLVL